MKVYGLPDHNYYVYITTNPERRVLYIGVTNSLETRIEQHYHNRGNTGTFAGKFYCYFLIYSEHYTRIKDAISREKELKKWSRKKKEELINSVNPQWNFLNEQLWSYKTWR